ncbi:diguanylate cyclase [Bacterioplanoides sp.]|uniref:sensor domain-containing diguanylate cyclase n=1 Tax=Bacterioplanoides sp. TaxID=2066072 RepID=UPI003B5C43C9
MTVVGRKLDQKFLSHLQSTIDTSPACIIIAEAPDGEIIYINESVVRFRGQTDSRLLGIPIEEYMQSWKEYSEDGQLLTGEKMPLGRALVHGEIVENEIVIVELDDGRKKWALASAAPVYDDDSNIIAATVIWYDITAQKELEQQLQHHASFDFLTSVYSRRKFLELAERLLARSDSMPIACLMLDVDDFKKINDTLGHEVGDQVLVEFSQLLSNMIRPNDLLGRYGGDEFLILMPGVDKSQIRGIAETINRNIGKSSIDVRNHSLSITTSIGAYALDQHTATPELCELFQFVDAALYMAKKNGKNCVHCYISNYLE